MSYIGFNKLKGQLAKKPGVKSPGGVAAAIGIAKYGKKRFFAKAARGRKKTMREEITGGGL